jgi:Spy/CpxP family protein refolding chaperone
MMFFAVLAVTETGCARFGGPFHRWHGNDMPGAAMKRLDSKVRELNLTPVQQAKYDELRTQVKAQLLAAKEDRRQFREIARTELAKDAPDVAALNAMIKTKIERGSAALQNDLDLFAAFYAALDKEQQQKVLAGIRDRMAAHNGAWHEEVQ